MIKLKSAVFFLFLSAFLSFQTASAELKLDYYGINDTVHEDSTVSHSITLQFSESVDNLNYQLDFPIFNLTAKSDFESDCSASTSNSHSIISCNFVGMTNTSNILTLRFDTKDSVTGKDSLKKFTVNYGVSLPVDRVFTIIRLPEKGILASLTPSESFSPPNGDILTDGRRIMVFWNLYNQSAGNSLQFSVDYTFSPEISGIPQNVMILILLAVVVTGVIAAGIYLRHGQEPITAVLNGDEKAIVGILEKEGGKALQKVLVKESGFSKAKVSRLVKSLKSRNIIDIEPVSGRENRVILKVKGIAASQ